jgi:hypothetical protein
MNEARAVRGLDAQEETVMRKLLMTLAVAAAALSAGALASRSDAAPVGAPAGLRGALDESRPVENVRLVCTHWWNGHYHRRAVCFWTPRHRHHHHHRHHWR